MEPLTQVVGTVCPLDMGDVDTDQIIPKQFLKRIERAGYGPFAFFDWRYLPDGSPNPEFVMNQPQHQAASILLAEKNFGCGSSREHAPWALEDAGFKAIIAPSFADIFRNNCAKIGVLTVELAPAEVRSLFDAIARDPSIELHVDLEAQTVTAEGFSASFAVDPHTKHCLLNGLDQIALTLQHEDDIARFEESRPSFKPRVTV